MEEVARDAERIKFGRDLRQGCRQVYMDEFHIEPDIAAAFGDALAFYALVHGLSWDSARSLANAAYFYPNDVIRASDQKLLEVKGLGPAKVAEIRKILYTELPKQMSTSELLDKLLNQSLALDVPDQSELVSIYN